MVNANATGLVHKSCGACHASIWHTQDFDREHSRGQALCFECWALQWLGIEATRLYLNPIVNGKVCDYAVTLRDASGAALVLIQGHGEKPRIVPVLQFEASLTA